MSNQEVDIWMPVYIGDMLAKTTRMTTEQIGASFLVLMDYWRNGAIPNDNNIIASITRLSLSKAKALKDVLIRANLLNVYDEEIRSEYLDNLKTQAESNKTAKAERAKKAAEARWNKSQDNVNTEHNSSNTNASNKHDLSNANAYPQAMHKQCLDDAKSMLEECPSSSPSSINNISITHEQNLHDENSKGDDRFLFDLDTVNTRIKLRGLKEITQNDLNKLLDDLQNEYGHRNQMVKNQVLGKLVQWVERRQQTPLTPPEKPNVKRKQSTNRSTGLNVNDAWKDQPMDDQPFYGTVKLPEGME
ncbi:DUF1376 domain-containing protein [Acinetobacter piscicola]|uniref:DUF1376 domain-containing protein n=1 Tax=Acinetobacter piscicola TaxID=2006115 RepID=UPI0010209610|nr:DUF1376 domain-containing protein [Acinetobacter piscicola]RYL27194.1 DUF1376 domain-containing protein [Acinetobacter piscicola]